MVMTVNIHEAKTQFSKLAKLVEQGEQIFIARNGKVIMKLVPLQPGERTEPRDFNVLSGAMGYISDEEWHKLDQDLLAAFEPRDFDD